MKIGNSLDTIRIASPCTVSWDRMTGDGRVRLCDECQLSVYNIAELTRAEAEALIAIGVEPLIDITSPGKTIIISGEMLRRLPLP